jgi:signal transduction histidine kinase
MKKSLKPELDGGYGLFSIRERLRYIDGTLKIKSKPGQGTAVIISAPKTSANKAFR